MALTSWLRVSAAPEIRVVALPLACCALEVESAVRLGLLRPEVDGDVAADCTAALVAGTVTGALAPVVQSALAELPEGTRVVAYGACATSGGPYWDAPSVVPGVGNDGDVDLSVPGCPPAPDALLAALLDGCGRR